MCFEINKCGVKVFTPQNYIAKHHFQENDNLAVFLVFGKWLLFKHFQKSIFVDNVNAKLLRLL